jgi:hypothetical protein
MKKFSFIFLLMCIPGIMMAQMETVVVPSDYDWDTGEMLGEGSLNNAIQAKIDAGTLSSTIFQLQPRGYYILIGTINVPNGEQLTIVAPPPGNTQETAPPQIVWTSTGSVNNQYIIDCYGHLTMRNLWIRYANTDGSQVGSTINFANMGQGAKQYGVFENVIFEYSPCPQNVSSGAVTISCEHFNGTFTNCYWKNCIDTHLRYYGRALSFPYQTTGWHGDSVSFENCTFANIGYVLMQEGSEHNDYVKFNHCTFLNVVMFPLESGWWYNLAVTNCLFSNCWMFGWMPYQTGTGSTTGKYEPNGGTLRIDSVANFNFEPAWAQSLVAQGKDPEKERKILFTNSSYSMDQWLVKWMMSENYWADSVYKARASDAIPLPHPMLSPQTLVFFDSVDANGQKAFPYINRKNLYNGLDDEMLTYPWTWGTKRITQVSGAVENLVKNDIYNPMFIVPPTDTVNLKAYMEKKWWNNQDTTYAWHPEEGLVMKWPLSENLDYTNNTLRTAGMGGFPLGDLFRWGDTYQQWLAQKDNEDAEIDQMLNNPVSVDKMIGTLPEEYALYQNYPNPFNPTTCIQYAIPKREKVVLKVYSLLGQEVATLVNEVQEPSQYKVTFDGRGLASGVYFYQLKAGNTCLTKKFVLVK